MPRSEEELAAALAASVERYVAGGTGVRSLDEIADGLHGVLYHMGSDGILELSVSQSQSSTCITLLGIVIWVEDQTLGPLEAEFHLDNAEAVKAFAIRAGDKRIARRDAPSYPLDSWRKRLRFIEGRPIVDEDWDCVLRHEFN